MNTTKKSDREKWIARASQLMWMDDSTRVVNGGNVVSALVTEFGISRGSAQTALARAALRARGKLLKRV